MENNKKSEIMELTNDVTAGFLSSESLKTYGFKGMDATTARKFLARDEIANPNMTDDMAVAIATARNEMKTADKRAVKISLLLAAVRTRIPYEKDPKGNFYGVKGETRFIKDNFDGFARSTLANYMNVGTKIYLPIAKEMDGYDGLEDLLDLAPATLKEAVACFDSMDGINFIRDKMSSVKKLPSSRTLAEWKNEFKQGTKDADKTLPNGDSATTKDELNGDKFRKAFTEMFRFEYVDGCLYVTVDKNVKDAVTMIEDAAKSNEGARLFMTYFADDVKRVTKNAK